MVLPLRFARLTDEFADAGDQKYVAWRASPKSCGGDQGITPHRIAAERAQATVRTVTNVIDGEG